MKQPSQTLTSKLVQPDPAQRFLVEFDDTRLRHHKATSDPESLCRVAGCCGLCHIRERASTTLSDMP
jgi:cytochrome c553